VDKQDTNENYYMNVSKSINNSLKYTNFEKINCKKPVNRLLFLRKVVTNKIVMDLGALDETEYKITANTKYWLHRVMSETANKIIGIDSSELLDQMEGGGYKPFPNTCIYKGNVFDLDNFILSDIDIIVAGELIEHLNDAQMFLKKIKSYKSLENKKLIITTPNACSIVKVILALFGRENMHKDHVNIFSYKTLNTICKKAEMKNWEIIPCYSVFSVMILKSHGIKKIIILMFQKFINIIQFLFPLLSEGWILIIDL
jgi:hypothetical protein